MGELSEDLERCLCDCACDADTTARATCACAEGRMREAKRVLIDRRRQLLDDVHMKQRGIDAIDHVLHRIDAERAGKGGDDHE
ncbi:hypothetical protein [Enorma burkinafasonensis]|uniref:hypothetical protein n=1 Tax=Enorma burkinafasonensis TaxID=2590867 RepID=UPI0026ECE5E6|nr:hypothetical protein [Enorma burkinafasonensis]MCI7730358.1 hypothetical protein [Enorma burkinafasonensis]